MAIPLQKSRTSGVQPLTVVAEELGLRPEEWEPFGDAIGKLNRNVLERVAGRRRGRYVLVTTTTPTRSGEGKTVVTLGLVQALRRLGYQATATLRQPAMAPLLGRAGGATGGGRTCLYGEERINFHGTGDGHAVAMAHNYLAALIDNHIYHGNRLQLDPERIFWRRVMDINDRSLRSIITAGNGAGPGSGRRTGFDVLGTSEIMGILALSGDPDEMRLRLEEIVVGLDRQGRMVHAGELAAGERLARLLADAIRPNLVQSCEGAPVLLHGSPYADFSVGSSSVIADRIALGLSDYVVTEVGMGADCGVEKLVHLKCAAADLQPALAVLVTTVKALKMHGGLDASGRKDNALRALQAGCGNLAHHLGVLRTFGLPVVVAVNRFPGDTPEEIQIVVDEAEKEGAAGVVAVDVFHRGGAGGMDLARMVSRSAHFEPRLHLCYRPREDILTKIRRVAQRLYGAGEVALQHEARAMLGLIEEQGLSHLPVCIAKTSFSLSHLPALQGVPRGFTLPVVGLRIAAGGRYIVVETLHTRRMPGLPPDRVMALVGGAQRVQGEIS